MSAKACFEFDVRLSIPLDDDFTADDAKSSECQRQIERELFTYLQGWRSYPKACDCEVMNVTIEVTPEREREKGEDDGLDYSHPGDALRGLED